MAVRAAAASHTAARKTEQCDQPVLHIVMCPENCGLCSDADYVMIGEKEFGRRGIDRWCLTDLAFPRDPLLVSLYMLVSQKSSSLRQVIIAITCPSQFGSFSS